MSIIRALSSVLSPAAARLLAQLGRVRRKIGLLAHALEELQKEARTFSQTHPLATEQRLLLDVQRIFVLMAREEFVNRRGRPPPVPLPLVSRRRRAGAGLPAFGRRTL